MTTEAENLIKIGSGYLDIPAYLMEGIREYVVNHRGTGHFLQACIENDLLEAVSVADQNSIKALKQIVIFLYNHTPADCCGNKEKYKKWVNQPKEEHREIIANNPKAYFIVLCNYIKDNSRIQ